MAMMGGVELTAPACRRSQPIQVKAMLAGAEGASMAPPKLPSPPPRRKS